MTSNIYDIAPAQNTHQTLLQMENLVDVASCGWEKQKTLIRRQEKAKNSHDVFASIAF